MSDEKNQNGKNMSEYKVHTIIISFQTFLQNIEAGQLIRWNLTVCMLSY